MNVMGIHTGHDASVSIVSNGKLISNISIERLAKKKKYGVLSKQSVEYALKKANLTMDDIDCIALSDYHKEDASHIFKIFNEKGTPLTGTSQTLFGNTYSKITGTMLGKDLDVYIIPHHTSHAASAYYTSDFDEAMCFSLDASQGNVRANSAILYGIGNKLYTKDCPGLMIGVGYSSFTEGLGLGPGLVKAGSLMGLASYGKPSKDVIKNIEKYVKESFFTLETTTSRFKEYYKNLFEKWDTDSLTKRNKSFKNMTTIAANIQYIFEKSIMAVISNINNKNKEGKEVINLCLSGGSFLNCNVNSLIKNESKFKNIHHFPACTDDGIAVGAALFVAHTILDEPRSKYSIKDISYCGIDYDYVEPDYETVAKLIADGKIVGWFMGASECGPRALGNRSILADPRNFHNRELINFTIKRREWFRPLAPSVLEEECSKWFDFDDISPYMLYTAKVLKPELVPAITHIDGTARMQTVNEETNPTYYKLIKKFYDITGVPMILNTSLNGMDEPILETEEDAMEFFKKSSIDAMVISGKLYTKG